uniref:Uncharacterized protein n=1 Tax=viral metagenome TaxID=1070528 RepID=A0A6H1ZS39_9ZZZZ
MVEIIKEEKMDPTEKDMIQTVDLDQLVEGNNIFESKGFSYLKVTQGQIIKRIAIPIKSSGVSEMIDEFEREKKPLPPKKRELIKKDSDVGKEMRLMKNEWAWVFDFADEKYLSDIGKYQSDLGLKVVMLGINLPIRDKDGNDITDDDRRLQVLKKMGLTGEHLTQLVKDIQSLTQWQEDKDNDFLAS